MKTHRLSPETEHNDNALKSFNDVVLETVRELGFNNTFGLGHEPTEQVFFLGPVMNGHRESGSHATSEAILDFIAYFENQVAVAKEYLANNRNNKTHEWIKPLPTYEPSVEAQVVVQEILAMNGLLDYSKVQDGAKKVDALIYRMLSTENRAVAATAERLSKRSSSKLISKTIPSQGGEVVCTWPPVTLGAHGTVSSCLEMENHFVLKWILMNSPDGLEKLSVIDLLSGDESLFVTPGTFPAQIFGEEGYGPTFESTVTRIGERLILKVSNLSDNKVSYRVAAFGRCFNTYQDGIDYLKKL